ncbi:MAG: nucleotidyl transferase AbiEii/AbiGii toxin family protein [Candidatus Aminicenantes bacterium]|nr:nucleotidyl transferase AbiEii/AbiGii toxin family protein [Candidatus Aminicenantes bacterium]
MNNQLKIFLRVLDALDKQKVQYILVGGVAVILHGIERLTRDIDIFVKMDDKNIEQLRKALLSIFEDESIKEITLEELQEFAVIRYGTPDDFYIDIMARIGEVAVYEDLEYETIHYEGTKIKIATPETLYNLKKDSMRYKDKFDAAYLKDFIDIRQKEVSEKRKPKKR